MGNMSKKSLAEFISTLREEVGLSQTGLAAKANLDLTVIEAVESGQELFLSSTVRQKIANALKIRPMSIKIYEKDVFVNFNTDSSVQEEIKERILMREKEIFCPNCNSVLITRIAKMYDLEDNLVLHPKARCSKCVFQVK